MKIPEGDLDLLAIGETLVDFISIEETDWLRNAYTFRKYQGGSPANIAVYVAKLGGKAAVISKTGIGAMGQFLKAELGRAGVICDYLVMDHRVHTSVIFVSRTARTADFEAFRSGDFQLDPDEIDEEAIAAVQGRACLHMGPVAGALPVGGRTRLFCGPGAWTRSSRWIPTTVPRSGRTIARRWRSCPVCWAMRLSPSPRWTMPAGSSGANRKPEEYIERFHEMGPEVVILTMGARGVLLSEGGKPIHIPARPIKAVDATGAGDSFWAGFLVALARRQSRWSGVCSLPGRSWSASSRTVGPLPDNIDRQKVYDLIDSDSTLDDGRGENHDRRQTDHRATPH